MSVRDLIAGLGGASLVASALGLTPAAISNWSARDDVPRAHHLRVWRMALEADVDWEPLGACELRGLLAQADTEQREAAA